MVRHVISLTLVVMITLILLLMPDFKTTVSASLICLFAFVALNIILDKSDSVSW